MISREGIGVVRSNHPFQLEMIYHTAVRSHKLNKPIQERNLMGT
jgi:hypothetical protein